MKKAYTKPQLLVEDFALTQTVASGCGTSVYSTSTLGHPNHWGRSTCGWDFGDGMILWVDSESSCSIPWGADDDFNGYCYNNPDGGISIFAS